MKSGDGTADLKPLAHLYKSQVYQLASSSTFPEIRRRPPTTDTFPWPRLRRFYFAVPYDTLGRVPLRIEQWPVHRGCCGACRAHSGAGGTCLPRDRVKRRAAALSAKRGARDFRRLRHIHPLFLRVRIAIMNVAIIGAGNNSDYHIRFSKGIYRRAHRGAGRLIQRARRPSPPNTASTACSVRPPCSEK